MAKMQGITGKISGKMGAAVFRVRDGQQIVTQYNPIVKNPKSAGQQDQRAKFKLMSQLAAIMAPGFGTMSVTTRKPKGKPSQRNAFTQLNFPLVEVVSEDETVTAKIPMEQLKLTSSFRYLPQVSVRQSEDDIEATFINVPSDVTTTRVVLIGYSGPDRTQASIVSITDFPVEDHESHIVTIEATEGKYTLLAYGLIPSESAKVKIDLDNIHTPADDDFVSAVQLNAMVADGSMAETMTVGANVTVE